MSSATPSNAIPQPVTRRTAVKAAVVGTIGVAAGVGAGELMRVAARPQPSEYLFLTEEEANLVIAICEELIPRDDAPGATDAGVVHYIDRQLAGRLRRHQGDYRRGLNALQRSCLHERHVRFSELNSAQKQEVLRTIEAGAGPGDLWGNPAPQAFFRMILSHTMQGFYGNPRHGGNRQYASYRMLGIDYPQIIGQNRKPRH